MRTIVVLAVVLFGIAVVNFALENTAGGWVCIGVAALLGCVEQARDAYRCAREDRDNA